MAAIGVLAASVLGVFAPANAAPTYACAITAPLITSKVANTESTYKWSMKPGGICVGDLKGPYRVKGSIVGTSQGLGLCDGSLVVTDLNLDARLLLVSSKGPAFNRFVHETWFAPITTYPFVTPFLASDASGEEGEPPIVGGGVIFSHIFLNCTASLASLTLNVHLL